MRTSVILPSLFNLTCLTSDSLFALSFGDFDLCRGSGPRLRWTRLSAGRSCGGYSPVSSGSPTIDINTASTTKVLVLSILTLAAMAKTRRSFLGLCARLEGLYDAMPRTVDGF